MNKLFLGCILISFIFSTSACSKKQMKSVLDDISRDTYENDIRRQRIENLGDPSYEEPPSYDRYQRERKEMPSDPEVTSSAMEKNE